MLQKKFFLSLIITITASIINPAIIEITSIHEVAQHISNAPISETDWLIFDLDNTVMWPTKESKFTDHGLKAWAAHRAKKTQSPLHDVYMHLLPVWFAHQENETVQPVETHVVDMIKKNQEQGVVVIGLSSRSIPVKDHTIRLTKSIGIDFSHTHPRHDLDLNHLPHQAIYHNGILFCGNNSKGSVLKSLLTTATEKPKRILFFDDLEKHVVDVKKTVEEFGIEFVGFRYGYLDEQVKAFKIEDHISIEEDHFPSEINQTPIKN